MTKCIWCFLIWSLRRSLLWQWVRSFIKTGFEWSRHSYLCNDYISGIYDQHAPADMLISQPRLYAVGRESQLYRSYSFWVNVIDALYQSTVIFFIAYCVTFSFFYVLSVWFWKLELFLMILFWISGLLWYNCRYMGIWHSNYLILHFRHADSYCLWISILGNNATAIQQLLSNDIRFYQYHY